MPFPATVRRAALLAVSLLLVTAASAQATDLYVGAGGTASGNCQSESQPCTFDYAVGRATSPDIVHVDFGTYPSAGNVSVAGGVTVRGRGSGLSIVQGSNAAGVPTLKVTGLGTVRDLGVRAVAAGANGVTFGASAVGDRVDVRADRTACGFVGQGAVLTSSLCVQTTTAAGQPAVAVNPGNANGTIALRNVTVVGEQQGILFGAVSSPGAGIVQALDLFNVLVTTRHAGTPDCPILLQGPIVTGSLVFHSTNSSHPALAAGGGCTSGTVSTPAATARLAAAPQFVDAAAGDYRPTPTSPARGAGVVDAANGAEDVVGSPRTIGGVTDVGAYQFVEAPTNTAAAPTGLTATTATLNAIVNNHGLDSSSSFAYGLEAVNEVFPDAINLPGLLTDQPVALPITGLTPNTTYRYGFCTLVMNFTPCLPEGTFTTLPLAPVVTGSAVSGVTQTTATLAATVNPGNAVTAVHVEYGPTAALGTASAAVSLPQGMADRSASVGLSDLVPGTAYTAQIVATNGAAATRGDVVTFVTAPKAPDPDDGSGGPGGNPGGGPGPSSAAFALVGRPKARKGVVTLTVRVPAAGKVTAKGTAKAGKRKTTYGTASAKPRKAGTVKLTIRPGRAAKRLRAQAKRLSVALAVTFAPAKGKGKTLKAAVRVK